jgi:hypothetical protein
VDRLTKVDLLPIGRVVQAIAVGMLRLFSVF